MVLINNIDNLYFICIQDQFNVLFVERPFLLNMTDSENNNSFVIVVNFSYTVIRDICLYGIYSIKCCILSFLTHFKETTYYTSLTFVIHLYLKALI